jgi:hypothetical protein
MYFWSIKKLKAQLIERPLIEKEVLPYLIATLLILTLAQYASQPGNFNHWDYLELLLIILINITGTYLLYKKNEGDFGTQFLHRYFVLGWVIMIRVFVFALPVIVLSVFIGRVSGLTSGNDTDTSWLDVLNVSSVEIFYYWYFSKHLA